RPATARHARAAIREVVKKMGKSPENYRFADGSGLSLYNYVSAELLTSFLRYAYGKKEIYKHLEQLLPIAGKDGTLKKRMRKSPCEGNVRAKTGTLTGIISLAGYCTASNGHKLAFTIINQGVLTNKPARDFQDQVCGVLCSQ
ncbi:MAG: D-alanyl-D-alanine carboxypeptidase, partial [Prevotella sp.]|nr:D-alanyl-D-alanine carboxypeptidase [Prevotella sp.]